MNTLTGFTLGKITLPRQARWLTIGLFIIADSLLLILVNQVLFPNPLIQVLTKATSGLLNATLEASVLRLLVVVGIVLFWFGHLAPRELGLIWKQLPRALGLTFAVWLLAQVLMLVVSVTTTGAWALEPEWARLGWTRVIGMLGGQLFGNALVEEIEYRGFLLPQLYLKLRANSPRVRLALAVVAALLVFTLMHIPNRLFYGVAPDEMMLDLLIIGGWSLLLSLIYLATGNLFIAVGVHALIDAPTFVLASTLIPQFAVAGAAVLVLIADWRLRRPALPRPGLARTIPSKI